MTAPLGTSEEAAICQNVTGRMVKLDTAALAADGLHWSFTPAPLAGGTYAFQAAVQYLGHSDISLCHVISDVTVVTIQTLANTHVFDVPCFSLTEVKGQTELISMSQMMGLSGQYSDAAKITWRLSDVVGGSFEFGGVAVTEFGLQI